MLKRKINNNMKINNYHILLGLAILTVILTFILIYTYSFIFGITFVFIFIVGMIYKLVIIVIKLMRKRRIVKL